ncbi:hypothetical protein HNQ80_002997 [Anaerosolibacter carboniphilus]|uniref:NERD domain-containing protein n=2 Tax=Anaerosolibacter carboniphilus TaxID=1417629 RepID=A0A841L142_9FIRM|nr:hypothetical protein [Anaerosolibacter carboniphilus]
MLGTVYSMAAVLLIKSITLDGSVNIDKRVKDAIFEVDRNAIIFHNPLLPLDCETCHIDYLVISKKGLFLLNILDTPGTLDNLNIQDQTWKAIEPVDVFTWKMNSILDPELQLQKSLFAMKAMLEDHHIKYLPIYGIIVYNDRITRLLKVTSAPIVKLSKLEEYLSEFQQRSLNKEIMKDLIHIICTYDTLHQYQCHEV